jgi:predicted glycosyltransferase
MLDELKAIENKQPSTWDREEVISKIVGHYDDLWVDEIQEIKNEKVEMD